MSRDYIDDPREDAAFSLRYIGETLSRIAATLEEMVELWMSELDTAENMRGGVKDPGRSARKAIDAIRDNRRGRQ